MYMYMYMIGVMMYMYDTQGNICFAYTQYTSISCTLLVSLYRCHGYHLQVTNSTVSLVISPIKVQRDTDYCNSRIGPDWLKK